MDRAVRQRDVLPAPTLVAAVFALEYRAWAVCGIDGGAESPPERSLPRRTFRGGLSTVADTASLGIEIEEGLGAKRVEALLPRAWAYESGLLDYFLGRDSGGTRPATR
jgi:hypothetical protein